MAGNTGLGASACATSPGTSVVGQEPEGAVPAAARPAAPAEAGSMGGSLMDGEGQGRAGARAAAVEEVWVAPTGKGCRVGLKV